MTAENKVVHKWAVGEDSNNGNTSITVKDGKTCNTVVDSKDVYDSIDRIAGITGNDIKDVKDSVDTIAAFTSNDSKDSRVGVYDYESAIRPDRLG